MEGSEQASVERLGGDRLGDRLLLTAAEAAAVLGVSKAHWYRMHNAGRIPRPVRLGGAVRWRTDELNTWIKADMPSRERWEAMKGGSRDN